MGFSLVSVSLIYICQVSGHTHDINRDVIILLLFKARVPMVLYHADERNPFEYIERSCE